MVSRKQFRTLVWPAALGAVAIVFMARLARRLRDCNGTKEVLSGRSAAAGARAETPCKKSRTGKWTTSTIFSRTRYVTRREGKARGKGRTPASNVNTLGEVPDGAWYTNRHYYHG